MFDWLRVEVRHGTNEMLLVPHSPTFQGVNPTKKGRFEDCLRNGVGNFPCNRADTDPARTMRNCETGKLCYKQLNISIN